MTRRRLAVVGYVAPAALLAVAAVAFAMGAVGCVDGKTPDCSAEAGVSCGPDFDANVADVIPAVDAGDGGPKDATPGDATGDASDAPAVDAPADSPPKG